MTNDIQRINEFARDFINNSIDRTPERKRIIAAAYYGRFGERLRVGCGTCYIEAIFKLIKTMEKKSCKYRLRKGQILQPFGMGIITNDNLTDEIAEECLRTHVANVSMFAVMPEQTEPADLTIIPPAADDIPTGETSAPVDEIPNATITDTVIPPTVDKPATEKPTMASPKRKSSKKRKK